MVWTVLIGLVIAFVVWRLVRAAVSLVLMLALGVGLAAYVGGYSLGDADRMLSTVGLELPDPGAVVDAAGRWGWCAFAAVQATGSPDERTGGFWSCVDGTRRDDDRGSL